MKNSIQDKILQRVRRKPQGWVFSSQDFFDVGSRQAVDISLHRLTKEGTFRRLTRGLYDLATLNKTLGIQRASDMDEAAKALARKFKWRIAPSGALALNALGLSEQVPAKSVFFSDGPSRQYKIGNRMLQFRHRSERDLAFEGKDTGILVSAMKAFGKERIHFFVEEVFNSRLQDLDFSKARIESRNSTHWIHKALVEIDERKRDGRGC